MRGLSIYHVFEEKLRYRALEVSLLESNEPTHVSSLSHVPKKRSRDRSEDERDHIYAFMQLCLPVSLGQGCQSHGQQPEEQSLRSCWNLQVASLPCGLTLVISPSAPQFPHQALLFRSWAK